jgi:tetratricopeptide (TPR) repeat protein
MIRHFLLFALLISSGSAQNTSVRPARESSTSPDLCVPPAGSVPPSLPARLLPGQGRVHFPITSSNPQAQEFFDQGVAQMHSFWATEAERSFLQAAELDPEGPMPQWGIAMVAAGDYRPRFQLEDSTPNRKKVLEGGEARAVEAARKALRLSAVPGKATALEKLYIKAIAVRRDPKAKDPDQAYIQALRDLLAQYPDEVEAKAYLALHLMRGFTLPDKKPRTDSMEAVALLKELMVKAPDHPGVHHYVIHGFEGSTFAKEAWPSCRHYPELAPNIPHALHMPGHIYSQTGKWKEAAEAFKSAAECELGYIRADSLYGLGHHGHNIHFLVSAYCFQDGYQEALVAARSLMEFKENPREAAEVDNHYTLYRRGWFSLMFTLVHFEKWDLILDGTTLPLYEKPWESAWRHWAMGLAYAAKGDAAAAQAQANRFRAALRDLEVKTKRRSPEPLRVAGQELKGHVALAANKVDQALEILQRAARLERSLRYSEPPSYPRPVLPVLGQVALQNGRLRLAESAFREALDQHPESARALRGLEQALQQEQQRREAGASENSIAAKSRGTSRYQH